MFRIVIEPCADRFLLLGGLSVALHVAHGFIVQFAVLSDVVVHPILSSGRYCAEGRFLLRCASQALRDDESLRGTLQTPSLR